MNMTTLLVPLWGVYELAKRIIPAKTAYVDIQYKHALALSTLYQGGIIAWVAFWAFYGQGFGAENIASVTSFGAAYILVVAIEPIADLAVLWAAKTWSSISKTPLFSERLHQAA